MQTKAFIQAWNEVPVLAEIMRILESKTFTGPGGPKKLGEPVIAVMSPLVRAMYTFLDGNKNALKEANASTLIGLPIPCPGLGVDCIGKIAMELDICPHTSALLKVKESHPLAQYHDFIKDLTLSLIKDAMPDHGEKLSSIRFIENFQITTRQKPESYPDTFEMFQGWESMPLEELVAVSITGTFLEPLAEILDSAAFLSVEPPMNEHEPIIREMKLLEKALISRINVLGEGMEAKEQERNKLLEGDNFIKTSRPKLNFSSLGSFAKIISIGMNDAEEQGFEPKDVNHPDFLRVKELGKELDNAQNAIMPYHEILWPIIQMDIDPVKMDGFNGLAIRQGFQLVAVNEPADVE